MCVKLTLLLILQGELYWMCIENLKVLHDLSIWLLENWETIEINFL